MPSAYRTFKHFSKRILRIVAFEFFNNRGIDLFSFMIMLDYNLIVTDNINFAFSSICPVPQINTNKSAIRGPYRLISSPLFANNSGIYRMTQISL